MTCKAGHILNWDGYCRICGAWLVDINGPASPFPVREDSAESEGDNGSDDVSAV